MDIKTDDFYKHINNDVDKWLDTSNYDKNDNRPLETGKNKKVIGKFKDELGGNIMTEFCALRAKQEYQSDNAGKMIVSQDFEGNKYRKISNGNTNKIIVL